MQVPQLAIVKKKHACSLYLRLLVAAASSWCCGVVFVCRGVVGSSWWWDASVRMRRNQRSTVTSSTWWWPFPCVWQPLALVISHWSEKTSPGNFMWTGQAPSFCWKRSAWPAAWTQRARWWMYTTQVPIVALNPFKQRREIGGRHPHLHTCVMAVQEDWDGGTTQLMINLLVLCHKYFTMSLLGSCLHVTKSVQLFKKQEICLWRQPIVSLQRELSFQLWQYAEHHIQGEDRGIMVVVADVLRGDMSLPWIWRWRNPRITGSTWPFCQFQVQIENLSDWFGPILVIT